MAAANVMWMGFLLATVNEEPTTATPASEPPPVLTGSIDTGVYAGRQQGENAVALSPRVQLGVRARPEVELGISMGAVSVTAQHDQNGRSRTQGPSNFVFGARWVRDTAADRHHGYLGFAFALPMTFEPDAAVVDAHRLVRGSRGGLDPWQWSPATMAVVVPAGWALHVRRLDVGVDGAVGGMFSASGDLEDPGFVGQIRGSASVQIWRARVGGALAAVHNGREELGALQTSAQPFVSFALCRTARLATCGVHFDAGATINIDAPYGFGGDGRRMWGTQFGLRWALRDAEERS